MSNERVFKQWPGKPAGWHAGMAGYSGRPDGAAVDVQGNYYVAMFEGGRVIKLSPAGEVLAEFPVPTLCPTMPCFGGDDLKTLYLTTARHHRTAAETRGFSAVGLRVQHAGRRARPAGQFFQRLMGRLHIPSIGSSNNEASGSAVPQVSGLALLPGSAPSYILCGRSGLPSCWGAGEPLLTGSQRTQT